MAPAELNTRPGSFSRDAYRAAILWLAGRDFHPPELDLSELRPTDLSVYWNFEFDWKRAGDADALLPRVRAEILKGGTVTGLLRSLDRDRGLTMQRSDGWRSNGTAT
ncbi:MAG: hypothetical protein ACYC7A_13975 [Thermoanaerobaculia bacterium]